MTAAPPDVVIRVEHVRTGFGDNIIQSDVSFEVRRGEIFVILGGSGCGKSVLMRHMIGLYQPLAGHIYIDGEDITTAVGAQRMALLQKFGVMYQLGALFGSMTLLENVRLPLEVHSGLSDPQIDLVARMKLGLVGLAGYEDFVSSEISGGMMKRAAIARAMALDPQILMLDELSAGLDPVTSAGIDELVLRLRDSLGITFVVVTHELASIYAIADRAIMLDKRTKGIIAEGKPQVLRDTSDNPWVRQFFRREAAETQ